MSDEQIQVVFGGDATGVSNAAAQAAGAISRVGQAGTAARSGLSAAAAGANDFSSALRKLAADAEASRAATANTATSYQQLGADAKKVADAHAGMSGPIRESLVLIREASRGNFSRMAGSASILAGQLGLLPALLNPVTLSIAAVAVAVGGVAVAMNQGAADQVRFANAIKITGGFAGVTEAQLNQMTLALGRSTEEGSVKARAALLAFAQAGQFTGSNLKLVTEDTLLLAKALGTEASQEMGKFTELTKDTVKGAYDLQQQTHALTAEQFNHVIALVKSADATGDFHKRQEAISIVLNAVKARVSEQTENLGLLDKVVRGVTQAFGNLIEAIRQFGRSPTTDVQLKSAEDLRARLLQVKDVHGQIPPLQQQQIAKLDEQIAKLKTKLDLEQKSVTANAAQAQSDDPKIRKAEEDYERSKNKKGGADKATELEILKNQLQQELEANRNFFADSNAAELAFWEKSLSDTRLKAAERLQIKTTIYNLEKQAAVKAYADQLQAIKGEGSVNEDAARALAAQAKANFDLQRENYRELAAANVITKTQEAQKLLELAKAEATGELAAFDAAENAKMSALQRELALAKQVGADTAKIDKDIAIEAQQSASARLLLQSQLDLGIIQKQNAIADSARDAAAKTQKAWETAIKSIENTFSRGLSGMITGQTTFAQFAQDTERQILTTFIESQTKKVAALLVATATGRSIRQTEGSKEVAGDAGKAAAGAYAATAGIPIVGPVLAPAAAAAAFAAVEGFSAIASAAGGWDNVPYDGAPAILHKQEMVLPAHIATPMRAMLSGLNGSGPGGAPNVPSASGDTHIHVHAMDAKSFANWLNAGGGKVITNHLAGLRRNNLLPA